MYEDKLADYYDDFFYSKEYEKECDFIKKSAPDASRILDIGCGTGAHIKHLSTNSNFVQGVDISPSMIKKARNKFSKFNNVNFFEGFIEDFSNQNNEKFDVAISMFHVVNHILHESELDSFFKTVSKNLKNGGIFIFDCYNLKAIHADAPRHYIREIKSNFHKNKKYKVESTPFFSHSTSMLRLEHYVTIQEGDKFDFFNYELRHLIWSERFLKELIDKYFKSSYKLFSASDGKLNTSNTDYKIKFIIK